MKIELKNVKISESLSEETTAFTADIYVDGKKAGYARNDGRGGCTNYHPFQETRELFNKAEKFTLTLPKIKYDFNGKTFEMDSNMENVIDNLLEKFQSDKDRKKMEKICLKGFVKSTAIGYTQLTYKMSLKDMVKIYGEKGVDNLQRTYDNFKSNLKEGEKIINTNLEELGVKL